MLQAGTSGKGREFAANYGVRCSPSSHTSRAPIAVRRHQARRRRGRPFAGSLQDAVGIQPIVGASRAEAADKQAKHNALVPLEGGLAILSGHLDFNLSTLPLDTVLPIARSPRCSGCRRAIAR